MKISSPQSSFDARDDDADITNGVADFYPKLQREPISEKHADDDLYQPRRHLEDDDDNFVTSKNGYHSTERSSWFKPRKSQQAFRIVCHSSIIGVIIGNGGTVISQLRRESGASVIHCENPVLGTEYRVIEVAGSVSSFKSIRFRASGYIEGGNVEEEKLVKVTGAQLAMLRVLDIVWEVGAENEGVYSDGVGIEREVCCRLLAHTTQIGAVVGKGGKHINKVSSGTGATINIFKPPKCAAKDEELIVITGNILAVKMALLAVSECLNDCPPLNKAFTPLKRRNACNLSAWNSTNSSHLLSSIKSKSIYDAFKSSCPDEASNLDREVVFRILCSNSGAGSVIGKSGTIVKSLENKTGASIRVSANKSEFGERMVTISALENLGSEYSSAQHATLSVFARTVEDCVQKGCLSNISNSTARLLISSDMADSWTKNEGRMIAEVREVTGAHIQILQDEKLPPDVSEENIVVEIVGQYERVDSALMYVTSLIRENLLPLEHRYKAGAMKKAAGIIHRRQTSGTYLDALKGNPLHERDDSLATVTNTTVEILIADHVLYSAVYGKDGGNLKNIKEISGAKVEVHDPSHGESKGRVVISGTPNQTLAAQSLLQAFILIERGQEIASLNC